MTPPRIMQFGTSRFLQAHVDLFVHEAREAREAREDVGPVAIVKTSRSSDRIHRLATFNSAHGFPVVLRGLSRNRRVDERITVRSVTEGLAITSDWNRIANLFAEHIAFVVSNTGDTGYDIAPGDRTGRGSAPGEPPRSFPATLLTLLRRRWQANARPMTILPCELLSGNGRTLKTIICRLAEESGQDGAFIEWLAHRVLWVDTLVDRIVSEPLDPAGAVAEPYALWAIGEQPALKLPCTHPDILVTPDLETEERLKLHILNLGRTILADRWMRDGRPSDATVRGCLERPEIVDSLVAIWDEEVLPVFDRAGTGARARHYAETTLERFPNPFLDHKLTGIGNGHRTKVAKRIEGFIRWAEMLGCDRVPRLRDIALSVCDDQRGTS